MERRDEELKRRTFLLSLLMIVCVGAASVYAHVQNENNLYSDIEYSEAKQEIVLLHGIKAIAREGGASVFKPLDLLARSDLAYWAGNFRGLVGTPKDIREAALEQGLVASLEGYATYADVSQAYFDGAAPVPEDLAEAMLSREQFALYMGTFFSEPVNGKTLFDMAGLDAGPDGIVEDVEKEHVTEGGNSYDVFRIKVGGQWYQVSNHPKILNGPVDLTQWIDKRIEFSLYAAESAEADGRVLDIIKVGEAQFTEDEIAAEPGVSMIDDPGIDEADRSNEEAPSSEEEPSSFIGFGGSTNTASGNSGMDGAGSGPAEQDTSRPLPIILIIGGILLIAIVAWLFLKRK